MPVVSVTLRSVLTAVSLLVGLVLRAEKPPDTVMYLVPIFANTMDVAGAYGSLWRSETWVRNDAVEAIRLSECPSLLPPVPCDLLYKSGTTGRVLDLPESPAHAALLYVPQRDVAQVTLTQRLFELSRHAQPTGVMIPLVREDHFYKGSAHLIAIPTDATARTALRVYNLRGVPNAAAHIEFTASDGRLLAETVVSFSLDGYTPVSLGFAMIGDVATAFPQVNAVDRFDIRVTPVPADLEFWTMATVTDRDTQHVLVVTAN